MMSETPQGDASVITELFHHNTWANLKLLEFCEGLRDVQLDASAMGCYGSIRDTLLHYIHSEMDYVDIATGKLPEEPITEDRFPGFDKLKETVHWAGDELLALALTARADTIVRVARPQEPVYEFPLSGFMVQVLNHSTEHRTQISTIITQLGIEPPAMSGWKYMREKGEFVEYRDSQDRTNNSR